MSIFTIINSILYKEKDIPNNLEEDFSLYMVNRWISMYSPPLARMINNTSNLIGSIFETKEESYNFLYNIVPKVKRKKIEYFKKKKEDKKNLEMETLLAKSSELSLREILLYKNICVDKRQ